MDYDCCERNDFDKVKTTMTSIFFLMKLKYYFLVSLNMPAARGSLKSKAPPKRQKMSTISGKLTERNKLATKLHV